jgi:CRISPR-associated protein Csd1
MILQALKEYYDRKKADPDAQMAPIGWEWKEIPYIVVLNPDGIPVALESTYEGIGRDRRGKQFLVPQSVKRASGIASNLLWDTPEYALGVVQMNKKRAEGKSDAQVQKRVADQHAIFKKRIDELGNIPEAGLRAVKKFLNERDTEKELEKFEEPWAELLDKGVNLSFRLAGASGLVFETPAVTAAIQGVPAQTSGDVQTCLVTGQKDSVERLHASIKGVWGAQSSGANVVSFNLDAFRSYGKEQGANAPVGKTAAFAYTTALNHLLGKDSMQRIQVGDASTVFWAQKDTAFEKQILQFFAEPPKDDPDRNTRAVESLLKSPKTGAFSVEEKDIRFYVLGLAPNASRIAIRFWVVNTVAGMAETIRKHFEDILIVHGLRDRDHLSLFRLLVATAALGKADNIPPNLAGDTMRAILEGRPYPETLLQAAIRRILAERDVGYPRAALIKACLNRKNRYTNHGNQEEIKVSLDHDNMNAGYRLGRLFATLEKIQEDASPGINATIRDRFYGAASSSPVTVFGNLMRLKNHHLSKLENVRRRVNFERLIGEIMTGIGDFPAHLPLADQGRFAIGYYHQRQDFFTKKSDKE